MKTFEDVYKEDGDIERIELGSPQSLATLVPSGPIVSGSVARSGELVLFYKRKRISEGGSGSGTAAPIIEIEEKVPTAQLNGEKAYLVLGNIGIEGYLTIKNKEGEDIISLNGGNATAYLGGGTQAGNLQVQTKYGKAALSFNGETGLLDIGANLVPGKLMLRNIGAFGTEGVAQGTISMDGATGNITLGGNGSNGSVSVRNNNDIETIWIDGDAGDIIFRNADVAEEFNICPNALPKVEPGMVMVLASEGGLVPCDRAYDSRVAGIISGAGAYRPGIVLDKSGSANRLPVAVMGKVFCRVDASGKRVRAGDLLTTSARYGHAMRAMPGRRSFGSVVGKALAPLASGQGLVPVLVSLQ